MTIRKGESWGEPVTAPEGLHVVADDAAAREWVLRHRERDQQVPPFGVAGGDLARTVGGGATDRFAGPVMSAPMDLLRVVGGGRTTWAVAHVVARRSWWHGEVRLVMNAQYLGRYDVAPRSHPNDGKADVLVVVAEMGVRARLQARHRSRTGTHLPHPGLHSMQTATTSWKVPGGNVLWIDGSRWQTAPKGGLEVEIVVEPDAVIVHG